MWSIEQVVAYAGSSARFGAGEAVAVPSRWSKTGSSERALWGRYHGSGSEPYDVAVDHVDVAGRCTCPSRAHPCKHVVALLVLWTRGYVGAVAEPATISSWINRQQRRHDDRQDHPAPVEDEPPCDFERCRARLARARRNERVERLVGGLIELDRWLEDRLRVGLADPGIARFSTWDEVARRLTDARAGALANRVRRLAGKVGAHAEWHDHVLAEMGVLHLLAEAGQRVPQLPGDLADAVATACGWQVRKADVEATAPYIDDWLVAGRSDVREDLVEVRRVWLRGLRRGDWAMVLSFAAYRQALDSSLTVGTVVTADLHRYPGSAHRALVGTVHDVDTAAGHAEWLWIAAATTTAGVCESVGAALAREPWLERVPAIAMRGDHSQCRRLAAHRRRRDHCSIAPESARSDAVATLLAATCGRPASVTMEWTPHGVVPLTVFLDDRTIDVGPRADPSFVSAA